MTRPFRFKPSPADQARAILSTLEAMTSDRTTDEGRRLIDEMRATVKPKQTRGPRKPRDASDGKAESEVQKNIIHFLMQHERVALVIRTNSGAVNSGGYYVEFNHVYLPHRYRVPWPGVTPEMLISDLQVLLTDGQWMAIECKESGWTQSQGTSDKAVRERGQAAYLTHVRACGGIGIFATGIGDVSAALALAGYGGTLNMDNGSSMVFE